MNRFTQLLPFMQTLFDDPATARKAALIVTGIMKARSPRQSHPVLSGDYRSLENLVAVVLGGSTIYNRRPHGEAMSAGEEDGVCWEVE